MHGKRWFLWHSWIGITAGLLLFYKRWWQRFLVLEVNRGTRVLWSDLHKLAGLWSLWFLALMVVTGLWYFVELTGVDFDYPHAEPRQAGHQADDSHVSTDALLARAQQLAPDLTISVAHLPGGYYGPVLHVEGQTGALLVRDRANVIQMDAATADLVWKRTANELGWPARWVDTADPPHFGNFGRLASKIIWTVLGLLLTGLCLSGACLHYCRQTRHAESSRRAAVTAAYITTVIVLFVATYGAVREIATYGPPWPPAGVIVLLIAWTILTLAVLLLWMRKLR